MARDFETENLYKQFSQKKKSIDEGYGYCAFVVNLVLFTKRLYIFTRIKCLPVQEFRNCLFEGIC